MRTAPAILASAIFLVIAPGVVAGFIPWWISHWHVDSIWPGHLLFQLAGGILIAIGAIGLLDSFARFAIQGLGTPAPILPTHHLVVSGLYRYVRNPMYVGVVSAILGQGLMFGNIKLLIYGASLWLLFHLFVLVYEEPTLRASFGSEYETFYTEVPRWIPRLTPWKDHRFTELP